MFDTTLTSIKTHSPQEQSPEHIAETQKTHGGLHKVEHPEQHPSAKVPGEDPSEQDRPGADAAGVGGPEGTGQQSGQVGNAKDEAVL